MAVKRDKIIANAEKLVAKGKIEQAIKEYDRLLADSPGDVNTLNRVGDLWVRINRTDEAVRVFREIADRYSKDGFFLKSIAIYKKINKLDPSRLEVYGELAELYAKQGLAMEAKSQYQVLADYHMKQGDPGNALAVYRKIADLDPNSINVHVKLADLYSQNNQVKDALAEYDRVGKMLMKRGMLDEALQVFRKALKIDPKNVELAASLVDTLVEARDYDNAISLLENTLEANPGNARLVALLGKTHLAQGDTRSARGVLQAGLNANPSDLAIRMALSELHLKEGVPDDALNVIGPVAESLSQKGDAKAVELLNKIIAVEPLHTPTLAKLVHVYKALKRETSILASLNSLAEAYIAVQDHENAASTLEELIAREPQNAQHKDKLAFVRKSLGVEVATPEEIEEPTAEEIEETAEESDFALSPPPDIEIDIDEMEGGEIEFGTEPEADEFMEVSEEPMLEFGSPPAEVSGEAPAMGEDVDFVTEHLTEAEVFAKYGLAEKAIEHLETVLERLPDHIEANERLVRILIDEGQKEKVCQRAAHLLGIYQEQGDDGAFDTWFNDLVARGYAVSPGPPVEVEVIEEGTAPRSAPAVTRPVPSVREPEEVVEEDAMSLAFEDLPAISVEEPEIVEEELAVEEPEIEELTAGEDEEEIADLDFGEEDVAGLPEIEEVAELDFGEEEAGTGQDALTIEAPAVEEPVVEDEVAELDFGEEEAPSLPEIEEVAELDFGEEEADTAKEPLTTEAPVVEEPVVEEEVAELDFVEEEVPSLPEIEEVAELDFGEEKAGTGQEALTTEAPAIEEPVVEEEIAELDFGEEEAPALPEIEEIAELDFGEPAPEPVPEPVAAAEEGLDFGVAESTVLGGPAVEELGELDFYIEQELFDEARTKLDALLSQFPDSEDLAERRERINVATAPPPPEAIPSPKFSAEDIESELLAAIPDDDEDIEIHAEPASAASEPLIDESDLFAEEDDFFDLASELEEELLDDEEPISLAEEEQSLEDIFREFKKGVEQQLDSEDYDTHYNLGIAYKEMGLIDEAIGEFQVASKDPGKMIECCSMLGLCFLEKGMPQLAVKWYRKGLEAPEITEEENLGLLYDLGVAHLESGDIASAQKAFMEVYGSNSNYRDIVAKIKQIEEAKKS